MRVVEEQAVRSPEELASKTGQVSCQSPPVDPAIAFNRRAIRGRSSMNNAELKRKLGR